jgi:hypothetical protein
VTFSDVSSSFTISYLIQTFYSLKNPKKDQQPAFDSLEKFMEEGTEEKDTKNFIFYEKDEHPSRCGQCIIL